MTHRIRYERRGLRTATAETRRTAEDEQGSAALGEMRASMFETLLLQAIEGGATLQKVLSADVVKYWRPSQGTWWEYCLIRRDPRDWAITPWFHCEVEPPQDAKDFAL